MALAEIEKKIEQMVNWVVAKAFRTELQPIEIGRHITREMDLNRQLGPQGFIVPNNFVVRLSTKDYKRFESFKTELESELVKVVKDHARLEDYRLVGQITVDLLEDPSLDPSTVEIVSEVRSDPEGLPPYSVLLPDGRRVKLGKNSLIIGRLPESDIVISNPNVSRRHAELRRAGNDVILVDLGSTNGTRVNGQLVTRQRLNPGDEISIGGISLFFEAG
jgi:hypothetical protein